MFVEDALRVGVDLAEGDGLETTRPLEAQVEPADAREEGKNAERHCRQSA